MIIESCELYQFRNFENLKIDLSDGLNFFVGKNGQGKSNLIESLHILSSGRSFRSATTAELVKWEALDSALACRLKNSINRLDLRVIIRNNRLEYYIDGNRVAGLGKFIGHLVTVCFSPNDLNLVKGSPDGRRSLFDKYAVVLNPSNLRFFTNYQKALKNKNSLLKSRTSSDANELRSWNKILADNGHEILKLRANLSELIVPIINKLHFEFTKDPSQIDIKLSKLATENSNYLMEKYEQLMSQERDRGVTIFGPHRDDIEIILAERSARSFASQGQARSLVLALKLALIELVEDKLQDAPVVLLDDVDSELDQHRSQGFFDMLLSKKRQVLITGTDFSPEKMARDSAARIFNVRAGSVFE